MTNTITIDEYPNSTLYEIPSNPHEAKNLIRELESRRLKLKYDQRTGTITVNGLPGTIGEYLYVDTCNPELSYAAPLYRVYAGLIFNYLDKLASVPEHIRLVRSHDSKVIIANPHTLEQAVSVWSQITGQPSTVVQGCNPNHSLLRFIAPSEMTPSDLDFARQTLMCDVDFDSTDILLVYDMRGDKPVAYIVDPASDDYDLVYEKYFDGDFVPQFLHVRYVKG